MTDPPTDAVAPRPLPPHAEGPVPSGSGVLAIVGDASLREFLVEALEDAGYAVAATADVAQGLVAAAAAPPAVILLDADQAIPAGNAFADWYRWQPGPVAPVLLLSARGVAETVTAVEALGASGFLRLPFDLDALLTLVAHAPPAAPPGGPAKLR